MVVGLQSSVVEEVEAARARRREVCDSIMPREHKIEDEDVQLVNEAKYLA